MGRRAGLMLGQAGTAASLVPEGTAMLRIGQALTAFGVSVEDFLYNAATGNLSSGQVQQLKQQEQQQLVRAGMPAAQASQQAESDVTATLSTFAAPGALGLTWKGALPGGQNWVTQAGSDFTDELTQVTSGATGVLAWFEANWPWLALGGIGVWWLSREL